ncbi:hypothetical protein [Sorangium sp. So ce176]|uniref:hypothetical protein n=1 Tax=Sorangium sp. So ce176 TaxID=3133286 RepID=UPI003F5FDD49
MIGESTSVAVTDAASVINPSTHRPYQPTSPQSISHADEHRAVRAQVLEGIRHALEEIQSTIAPEDVPSDGTSDKKQFVRHFRRIKLRPEASAGFYDLNLLDGYIEFGEGMIETMRQLDAATLERFVQIMVLHETLHLDQGLYTSNHSGVSHASVVLEEIDYIADAVSLATAIAWRARVKPENQSLEQIARDYIDTAVRGMEIFDRVEQGDSIKTLAESRLRRYLIWNLQHVRAAEVETVDDMFAMLLPRLAIEIEPLSGTLDDKFEKIVGTGSERTQLFLSLGGSLVRQSSDLPSFDVAGILDSVRAYDWHKVRRTMRYVVDVHRDLLAPKL